MVHQGSTTVLLYLTIFMATLLVTPGAAIDVKVVKNKDEALAHCNSIRGPKAGYFSAYPGQAGKDVFYDCGYKDETQSELKAGTPCNPNGYKVQGPRGSTYYMCENNHWQIVTCKFVSICTRITDYK